MNSEGKVGFFEAVCFVTLIMTNKVFYASTALIVRKTGTAAWYATLISCAVSFIFLYIIYFLLKRFPGKDIAEINEVILGKIMGKLFTFMLCIYALFYSGSTLREFVEMIKTYNLPYTPTSIIMTSLLAVALVIAYKGFECVARVSAIFFIPVTVGLLIILLLASPAYNANLLKPVWGHGFTTTLSNGFFRSSAYIEFTTLIVLVKAVHGHKNVKKIGATSILITGAIFSISMLCYLMTFGYSVGGENISGIFELSRSIYFNRFFQRVESIFLFAWVISSVISTTISYYISTLIYCKVFSIKNHKPLLMPFAILVFIVAIIPKNMSEVIEINITFLRQYSLFVLYIPIVFLLLLSIILGKKGDKSDA